VVTSGKELFSNSLVSDNYKYKDELITTKTIAPCAIDTTAKCLNDVENIRKNSQFSKNDASYEFDSVSRRSYADYLPEMLQKRARNDQSWSAA
jgi:hypothetical protein